MTKRVSHTHLGAKVTYPKGMHPGDRITFRDGRNLAFAEGPRDVVGTVIDRAANGVGDGCELPGYWLWIQPDDASQPVRVRTWASGKRKGTAIRDDAPQWVRSSLTSRAQILADGHYFDAPYYGGRLGLCVCHEGDERAQPRRLERAAA